MLHPFLFVETTLECVASEGSNLAHNSSFSLIFPVAYMSKLSSLYQLYLKDIQLYQKL